METYLPIILVITTMTAVIGCNKGYSGGWGEPQPVIILPKPTLIPKLKQAFIDGKLSVNYHKIVAPSLKPLPYKKGVGWIGKGWGHNFNAIGYGFDHFDYPFAIGKTGLLGGAAYGKGFGYHVGKGIGVGKGFGIGLGKEQFGYGWKGPIGGLHGPGLHGPGLHHELHGLPGPIVPHHIPVTPIAPLDHKLPIPHGPIGHTHTVSQNSVTIVDKGLPHGGIAHGGIHGPIGNDLYGK